MYVAEVAGTVVQRQFDLRRCPSCQFAFVANPHLDYASIYNEAYYRGEGADPLVDYDFELTHPDQTIRQHEWAGVVKAVNSLKPLSAGTRWLDFGCGAGGLVRYAAANSPAEVVGYDVGYATDKARQHGIPIVGDAEIDRSEGRFDIITAIEVLEHIPEPLPTLARIRRLLRPGGVFFYTTGNARPFRDRLAAWRYVRPELHTSYFEPQTLELALRQSGFDVEPGRYLPGCEQIVRFKVLKNLGVRRHSVVHDALPWRIIGKLLNKRLGLFDHPIGRAPMHGTAI